MVIAEVCNYAPDYAGNFIASLKAMEVYAKKESSDHEVLFFFPKYADGKEWVNNLMKTNKVFFLPEGRIACNLELVRLCKRLHVDLIHVHFYGMISVFMVGWLTKTKVVHHFHNTLEKPSWLKSIVLRLMALSVTKFVGCSEAVYLSFVNLKLPKRKCLYITNCIDFKRLDQVKEVNPFHNNKRNLLILGSDFYRKGVDKALKVIEKIQDKYHLKLQIISHNPVQTRKFIEDVMGYQPEWAQVILPVEHIGDYYRASELFLSPSIAEGLCYAIPEALYCNCMVLKRNLMSMTYGLDGEEAITFGNDSELRERIEEILNLPKDEKVKLLSHLKEQVTEKYGVEKWGQEVFSLYKEVCS